MGKEPEPVAVAEEYRIGSLSTQREAASTPRIKIWEKNSGLCVKTFRTHSITVTFTFFSFQWCIRVVITTLSLKIRQRYTIIIQQFFLVRSKILTHACRCITGISGQTKQIDFTGISEQLIEIYPVDFFLKKTFPSPRSTRDFRTVDK